MHETTPSVGCLEFVRMQLVGPLLTIVCLELAHEESAELALCSFEQARRRVCETTDGCACADAAQVRSQLEFCRSRPPIKGPRATILCRTGRIDEAVALP
eukprot:6187409-Pleurochrysis_carterae.AAC.6